MCSDRKFMMIVLAIAIIDALLVGTELTADVLGILSGKYKAYTSLFFTPKQ